MSIIVGSATELNVSSYSVCKFYGDNWNRKIPLSDPDFFSWQFLKVPNSIDINNCCVALNKEGDIVGVMGANTRLFILEGKEINAAELTTWIVDPNYQNKGIGPKIIGYLKEKFDILLGLGITDSALSVYLRSGFRFKRSIPRFVKIVNWEKVSEKFPLSNLAKKISTSWDKENHSSSYYLEDLCDYSAYSIQKEFAQEANFFSRDNEYLKWRYTRHPRFKYHIKVVVHKESKCIVVYRIDDTPSGLKMMHVTDIYGDFKAIPSAINFVEDLSFELGVDAIDFYTTNVKMHTYFFQSSWFSINDDTYFKFPHLFHPLELREPASTSMVIWSKEYNGKLFDFSSLYISKQDCDLDRPSN